MLTESMTFIIPGELNAASPPEKRGIRRDHVKLLSIDRKTGRSEHTSFYRIDQYLKEGDLLVLNNSRTIPAILKGSLKRSFHTIEDAVEVRLAHRKNGWVWEALIVSEKMKKGDRLVFSDFLAAEIIFLDAKKPLQTITFNLKGTDLWNAIYQLGEPVRYEYVKLPWELEYYQTVYASVPGSVEMPSAGRAFSWELLFRLQEKGVKIAYLQLHTGLSYYLDDKWKPDPSGNHEEYFIPEKTLQSVLKAKSAGGRVIAVGTTVVRALETAAITRNLKGWTNLYVHSDFKLNMTNGIITGLHEPEASHLDMLSAFLPKEKLFKAYHEAVRENYLWHEFGDMNLIV